MPGSQLSGAKFGAKLQEREHHSFISTNRLSISQSVNSSKIGKKTLCVIS